MIILKDRRISSYAFGSPKNLRQFNLASARVGFNGKENDNDVKGTGNQQDYGMRIYDPRLGRFLSVDPIGKDFPWYSPFHFAGNSPIVNIDLDGLEDVSIHKNKDRTTTMIVTYDKNDIKQVMAKQASTIIPRIVYSKDGSMEKKQTAQFEGPGKDSETKLFKALSNIIVNDKIPKMSNKSTDFRASAQSIIPAPIEPSKPKTKQVIDDPKPTEKPTDKPIEKIKYVVFDIEVNRDFIQTFSDKGDLWLKNYIKAVKEEYKKEGYDEITFRKVTLIGEDKTVSDPSHIYDGGKSGTPVKVAPADVETGVKVKTEK